MNRSPLSRLFALSTLCAAMLPALHAQAGGFQLNEQSAVGIGRANSGEAAQADSAAVVASNPAAMSLLDTTTITINTAYIMPDIKAEGEAKVGKGLTSDTYSASQDDIVPNKLVPAGYLVIPVNEKLSMGFGAYSHFGVPTEYDQESNVSALAGETDLLTLNLNSSISYKFTDTFSMGLGVNAVYGEATLGSTLSQDFSIPLGPGGKAGDNLFKMEGDDWGYGWNAGALWQVTPKTRIGLTYRSEVDLTFDGKGSSDVMDGGSGIGVEDWNTSGQVAVTLPEMMELAVYHQLTDSVAVHASAMRTGWSSWDTIKIDTDNGSHVPEFPQEWDDTMRYSVGATWDYSKEWTLRTGLAYDETPTNDEYRQLRIPDGDKWTASLGASYEFDENHSIDMAYAYVWGDEVDINEELTSSGILINSFSGTVEGDAHIISAQYNYRF